MLFRSNQVGGEETSNGLNPLTLVLSDMDIQSGADRVRINGKLWPSTMKIETLLDLEIGDLTRFLKPFGVTALGGAAKLKGLSVEGDLLKPKVQGRLAWSRAMVDSRALGSVAASVALNEGRLYVSNLGTPSSYGELKELKASLQLFDGPFLAPSPSFPFTISKLHVERLAQIGRAHV